MNQAFHQREQNMMRRNHWVWPGRYSQGATTAFVRTNGCIDDSGAGSV